MPIIRKLTQVRCKYAHAIQIEKQNVSLQLIVACDVQLRGSHMISQGILTRFVQGTEKYQTF